MPLTLNTKSPFSDPAFHRAVWLKVNQFQKNLEIASVHNYYLLVKRDHSGLSQDIPTKEGPVNIVPC